MHLKAGTTFSKSQSRFRPCGELESDRNDFPQIAPNSFSISLSHLSHYTLEFNSITFQIQLLNRSVYQPAALIVISFPDYPTLKKRLCLILHIDQYGLQAVTFQNEVSVFVKK